MDRDSVVRLLFDERVKLLAWIRIMVRDEHLAEDILQEVSVTAVNKCEEIRDSRAFPSWARQVARHKVLHFWREQKNAPVVLDNETLTRLEPHWRKYDCLELSDLNKFLLECQELLSPYSSQLIRMRHQERRSGAFMAEALGRPLNTIYVALSRAYKKLGDCIRKRLAEQGCNDA